MTEKPSPLISIAMCTYNGERFLRKQLDSLIAQDYRPLEIHIVDDRSTDSTWNILNEYAQQHPFIHIHQNETNQGVVKNFEKALTLCTGEYIGFCDQDDIWYPNKISTHINEIGNASLTYSQLSYVDEKGNPIPSPKRKTNRLSGRCPLALLFHTCVTGHVALFKKEILDHALPFPEGIQAHDHWIPFVAAGLNGLNASNQVLSCYRTHGNNVSMKKRNKKKKNLLKRMRDNRAAFDKKLNDRLVFIHAARGAGVLSSDEEQLLDQLTESLNKSRSCFKNRKIKEQLTTHADQLLPLYKKPEKMVNRLSRGIYFFALRLWLRKP